MSDDLLAHIIEMALGSGAIWAAIRVDMAYLRAKMEGAEKSALRAHERIDEHVRDHGLGGK